MRGPRRAALSPLRRLHLDRRRVDHLPPDHGVGSHVAHLAGRQPALPDLLRLHGRGLHLELCGERPGLSDFPQGPDAFERRFHLPRRYGPLHEQLPRGYGGAHGRTVAVGRKGSIMRAIRLSASFLTAVLMLAAATTPAASTPGVGAVLQLTRTVGPPTSSTLVQGRGFGSTETVDLTFDADALGTA